MARIVPLSLLLAALSFVSAAPPLFFTDQQDQLDRDLRMEAVKTISQLQRSGTDRGLYNEGFIEGDIVTDPDRPPMKNAVTDPSLLWPFGIVVYKVEDDIGCPNSPQCDILMKAMEHYHQISCIRFKEWTGEENYINIFFNHENSGACWSSVGRVGKGEQRLSLGQRCWYSGIVIHELGHAIGFWHEMNRPDRDSWIHVYWNNIIPGFGSAFAKYNATKVDILGESFDFDSIMMYDEYAFSKDGISPTLLSTDGVEIGPIWKKKELSASDRRRLNRLYQCEGNIPQIKYPYDISCNFDRNDCGFKNGRSSSWQWKSVNETFGYAHCSAKTAVGPRNEYVSAVLPGLPAGDRTRGPLGCLRFYYQLKDTKRAFLQVEQSYLNRVTAIKPNRGHLFPVWRTSASGNDWRHVELPIYVTSPFKLVFTAKFDGFGNEGSAALDVFQVFYKPCESPTESGIVYYPEPPIRDHLKTDNQTSSHITTASIQEVQDILDNSRTSDEHNWKTSGTNSSENVGL